MFFSVMVAVTHLVELRAPHRVGVCKKRWHTERKILKEQTMDSTAEQV